MLRSTWRSRLGFGLAAILVPLALGLLFARQNARLRALADHGRQTEATIASVTTDSSGTVVDYRYDVNGVTHTWNVGRATIGGEAGTRFSVTYLPEEPSLSRPGIYTPTRLDAELGLAFQRNVLLGLFGFFAAFALISHRSYQRLREDAPMTMPSLRPETIGHLLAALFLVMAWSVERDPEVRKVQVALLGEHPLGLSPVLVVCMLEAVLLAPLFWVLPQLMRIVVSYQARGGSMSKIGIVAAVVRTEPELHRARLVVIAGAVYFFTLMAAWIAYAAYRGV